ncbi:hypothetical protein FRC05_001799 [Tulasnella sp. 425]|nr:hypothetical protein FRC05_001799 [Tulasnella sp. 425]
MRRIADLELTISQLEQDNARQISDTNALFDKKLYPRMMAFAKERDDEKAARKAVEDQLAEVIASEANMEEKKNADIQAAILDLQARADFIRVEELHKSLVRLGIVDPDDQQYPLAYPVCGDCMTPFLKSVCAAAKGSTKSGDGREQKQKRELATVAGHQAAEMLGAGDDSSEPVSEEPALEDLLKLFTLLYIPRRAWF